MKYFSEIENWQKYFGCIFKQGNNASITSMHPTPLLMQIQHIFILMPDKGVVSHRCKR
jgi:hypothetical protein